jgi:hypothetical protein
MGYIVLMLGAIWVMYVIVFCDLLPQRDEL